MIFTVEDQGPLPGLSDVAKELGPDGLSDSNIASAEAILSENVPLQATMGFRDSLHSLFDWLRRRSLVQELPKRTVSLPWFECHVPPRGTAHVSTTVSEIAEYSVSLKVFGSGYERGRHLKLLVTEESDPRLYCATYFVDLEVIPKVYVADGEESVVLEVVNQVGKGSEENEDCPHCGLPRETLDRFRNVFLSYIDLRQDSVRGRRTIELDWSEKQSFQIKCTIPGIDLPLELSVEASSPATWRMMYEFEPGYLYQPYRNLSTQSYQTPMWALGR